LAFWKIGFNKARSTLNEKKEEGESCIRPLHSRAGGNPSSLAFAF
jgi:hypothetical protein